MKNHELKDILDAGYWICFDCASKHGAKLEGLHTFSSQVCTLCKSKAACNAISDWHWPKELEQSYVWD